MTGSSSDLIREAIRHAETKQAAQLQIALAADVRAMTICVACSGIAGVLLSMVMSAKERSEMIPVVMIALTFFAAAGLAAWSARPIGFAAPGQDFSDFEDDIRHNRPLRDVLIELGGQLDECARENEARTCDNARFLRAALALAALAPLIGLLAYLGG